MRKFEERRPGCRAAFLLWRQAITSSIASMDQLGKSTESIRPRVLGKDPSNLDSKMQTKPNSVHETRREVRHKPLLTWGAVSLLPLAVIPFTAMAHGSDVRGWAGELATFSVIAVPAVGLLLLMGAWQRKERARVLAGVFTLIYGLWGVGMIGLLILGMMFGMGDNW